MNERKELIERLRDATEGPRMLINEAADMLEADAVPPGYGWLTACDEEMICYHLGVANLSDNYESAKRKLRALIDLNVAIATDPAVNGGMSLQPAVPQEPVAIIRCWTKNGEGHSELVDWCCPGIESLPDGEHKLFASPQQRPRLTDAEIIDLAVETNLGRKLKPLGLDTGEVFYTDASYKTGALIDFARKVRGEA